MTDDIETRLVEALTDRADQVHPSRPRLSAVPQRGSAGKGLLIGAAVLVVAGAAVAVAIHNGASPIGGPNGGTVAGAPAKPVAFLVPGAANPLQPGQYFYHKNTEYFAAGHEVTVVEVWEPQDPTQQWTMKVQMLNEDGTPRQAPQITTGTCGEFGVARTDGKSGCDDPASWKNPTPAFIAAAPLDPQALYDQLHQYAIDLEHQGYTSGDKTSEDMSTVNIAYLQLNVIAGIAESTNGLSQPFSQALAAATAKLPGVVITPNAHNYLGVVGTSYEIDAPGSKIPVTAILFDANGVFIGRPITAVSLGAADAPGAPPVTVNH